MSNGEVKERNAPTERHAGTDRSAGWHSAYVVLDECAARCSSQCSPTVLAHWLCTPHCSLTDWLQPSPLSPLSLLTREPERVGTQLLPGARLFSLPITPLIDSQWMRIRAITNPPKAEAIVRRSMAWTKLQTSCRSLCPLCPLYSLFTDSMCHFTQLTISYFVLYFSDCM